MQFSPNGKNVLTSGKDGKLRDWLRESGDELLAIPITFGWLADGPFSPGGQSIVAAANTDAYLLQGNTDELARLSVNELEAIVCQPNN